MGFLESTVNIIFHPNLKALKNKSIFAEASSRGCRGSGMTSYRLNQKEHTSLQACDSSQKSSCIPPTGHWTQNPGMCPNPELNCQSFRTHAQPTESHWPGWGYIFHRAESNCISTRQNALVSMEKTTCAAINFLHVIFYA